MRRVSPWFFLSGWYTFHCHFWYSFILPSTPTFVECDTNFYSVPCEYAGMGASVRIYVDRIEILIRDSVVASHPRSFKRHEKIEHPSHREQLLQRTPGFKYQRIFDLMQHMGQEIARFLARAGDDPLAVAYGLFRLPQDIFQRDAPLCRTGGKQPEHPYGEIY